MSQGRQPALQRGLHNWESIAPAVVGVAFEAWCAFNLGQDLASLAGAGRQVIRTLRHLARGAQASGDFLSLVALGRQVAHLDLGALTQQALAAVTAEVQLRWTESA